MSNLFRLEHYNFDLTKEQWEENASIFDKAAELVEKHGINKQGTYYADSKRPTYKSIISLDNFERHPEYKACTVGYMRTASGDIRGDLNLIFLVANCKYIDLSRGITEWNDSKATKHTLSNAFQRAARFCRDARFCGEQAEAND